jgi:hypothetical protein
MGLYNGNADAQHGRIYLKKTAGGFQPVDGGLLNGLLSAHMGQYGCISKLPSKEYRCIAPQRLRVTLSPAGRAQKFDF